MTDLKKENEPKDWTDKLPECFSAEGDFAFRARSRKCAAQLLAEIVNTVTWDRFEEEVRHHLAMTFPDLRDTPEMAAKIQRAEDRLKAWLEWD